MVLTKMWLIRAMELLLISATEAEISPLREHFSRQWAPLPGGVYSNGSLKVEVLIAGVGMVSTAYELTKKLASKKYDLVLQVGIAGTYDRNIQLGDVVFITSETMGDLGAEDHYNFLDVFDLGLADKDAAPFADKLLNTPAHITHEKINLPKATSLSINMTSGSSFTATARYEKYGCQIENMEGGAVHYICPREQVPFAQIRSISNYVEARDKSKWKIKDAVINLNKYIIQLLDQYSLGE